MLFTLAENYNLPIQKLSLQSLLRHNPDAKIFTKESIKELDDGEAFVAKFGHCSNVHFSDIFRMWYIYNFGGAWIDADCIHLRTMEYPYDITSDQVVMLYADAARSAITQTHVYAPEPGRPFLKTLLERQEKLVADKGPTGLEYLDLGEWSINHIRSIQGDSQIYFAPHWEHCYIAWYNTSYFHYKRHWGDVQFDRGMFNPNAYCYHLSNRINSEFAHFQEHDLLNHDSFLGFLCKRAMTNGWSFCKDKAILNRLPNVHAPYKYCEVGVYRGYHTAILGQQRNRMNIVGIDPWKNISSRDYIRTGDDLADISDADHEYNYQQALAHNWFLLSQKRIELLRLTGTEASYRFPQHHFDMVFIDGDHSYEGCKQDIQHWYSKVKPGGWLCGHDYKHPSYNFGVHLAVDEFLTQHPELSLELDEDYTWFIRIPRTPN